MTHAALPQIPAPLAGRSTPWSLPARDLVYLLLGFPLGLLAFTVVVTGLSVTAGLLITLLGLPVLFATLVACRGIAAIERARAALILVEPPVARERDWRGNPLRAFVSAVKDPAAWRDLGWSLALGPVSLAGFIVAVTAWGSAIGLILSPLYAVALPADSTFFGIDGGDFAATILRVLVGIALVPVAIAVCRVTAESTARAARAVLGS